MFKLNNNTLRILFIIVIILNASAAFSSVATLFWDAPTTNTDWTPLTDLAGYKVYYGTSSGNYSQYIDVGDVVNYTVSNLENGIVYYFAVTAYDRSGNESDYSNEVQGLAISIFECNLIPATYVIQRGGTLGFQATVTNNTDQFRTGLVASRETKPDGTKTDFLIGPLSVSLEPYYSKSWHRSHNIPLTAPLGSYTYHVYVGNYGVGIYDECTFDFEVVP